MKKILFVLLLTIVLVGCGKPDTGTDQQTDEAHSNVVYESQTKTGLTFQRHNDIDTDYMAAIKKTVEKVAPEVDTEPLNHKEGYGFADYSDGMTLITLPQLSVEGNQFGGQIMMQFNDDSHSNYSVYYLKIGDKTYIDDGTYDKEDYALEGE